MIFSELYSAYYNTVSGILAAAVEHPLERKELRDIIEKNAFGESILTIESAIKEGRWQLLYPDGSTPLQHLPDMPLTLLEKRWLKAIFADPRIRLFTDETDVFPEVEPLFTVDDISVFDKYLDGDPFEDPQYIKNFRLILDAIEKHRPVSVITTNHSGKVMHVIFMPDHLEYSEKDDKFRMMGVGGRYGRSINLARILKCTPYNKPYVTDPKEKVPSRVRSVRFELIDHRNALERVLMHFAHFEKQAEKIDENRYLITILYDKDDETELVIRILSFGPMIKVIAPQHFIELIKERLLKQKSCEQ